MVFRAGAALALAVMLGACSSPEPPPEVPAGPSDAADPPPAVTGPAGPDVTPTSQVGQWDPGQWQPTVQISATRLSEAEREAWRVNHLEEAARELDGPAPEVSLERWVHPRGEWDAVMSECMTDSGFLVEVDNGAISYPGGPPPAEQRSAWNLAWYTCKARFTPDPDYVQDWTEGQIGLVYDYWDQYFIPCMEAHGVPVNRSQQPSRDTYISTFYTPERSWWPTNYLSMLPQSQREQLEPVCAPYPPDEAFFGS